MLFLAIFAPIVLSNELTGKVELGEKQTGNKLSFVILFGVQN